MFLTVLDLWFPARKREGSPEVLVRRVRHLSRQDPQSHSRFMINPCEGSNLQGPTSETDHHWEDFNIWLLGRHRHSDYSTRVTSSVYVDPVVMVSHVSLSPHNESWREGGTVIIVPLS